MNDLSSIPRRFPIFSLARSVFHLKYGTLLWPALPAIIEPRRRNVGMPQSLLHFGNVRIMRQGIGGGSGTQSMHAETVHVCIDADHGTLLQSMRLSSMKVLHFLGLMRRTTDAFSSIATLVYVFVSHGMLSWHFYTHPCHDHILSHDFLHCSSIFLDNCSKLTYYS